MAFLAPSLVDGYYVVVILVLALIFFFWQRSGPPMDPREPPLLRPAIPVVGHLFGMFWEQVDYYGTLCRKTAHANFTINVLNTKVYVITSPLLAQAALRHKDLDFTTFVAGIGLRPFGIAPETTRKIRKGIGNPKEPHYMQDLHKVIYESLGPGPSLDSMNCRMLSKVAVSLNQIENVLEIDKLWFWLREVFTLATTFSLYGDHDPFAADTSLCRSMWDYDDDVPLLILGMLPSIIARKGSKGRAAVEKAYLKYFRGEHDSDPSASSLVRERGELHRRYDFSIEEQARFEISMSWAGTTNATPTIYWMLLYVASDRTLLEDIRKEVSNIITTTGEGANRHLAIDITKFKSDCPLLLSAYHETIRLCNLQISVRMVEADTVLSAGGESILVKKGNIVQIPGGVMHISAATWGPNAHAFDARRFVKQADEEKELGKAKKNAYIPFGGGKHLCPGRHFALAEILGMVAAVVTGFEISGADGGPVKPPDMHLLSRAYAQAVGKPLGSAKEVGVRLVRRDGMDRVKLSFAI